MLRCLLPPLLSLEGMERKEEGGGEQNSKQVSLGSQSVSGSQRTKPMAWGVGGGREGGRVVGGGGREWGGEEGNMIYIPRPYVSSRKKKKKKKNNEKCVGFPTFTKLKKKKLCIAFSQMKLSR